MKNIKKRRYQVEVFAVKGERVNDDTLRWVIDSTSGAEAISHVRQQLVLANSFLKYDIAQYAFSAEYLEDC